ncbi:MAG: polysaccharide deacetylase family protein, partial [Saprospiraceae bacterium]|nr:polysaccharide deacetylase family protein [Saprospiraceae bacterium]
AQFNFLGERPKTADCYYPIQHPAVVDLFKKIDRRGHRIGFHPSREAFSDPRVFELELGSLRAASPQPVLHGRHHYLCFSAPDTWQRWAEAGLESDSTLGYPEQSGFRCGMCQSFPVFNFLTRKELPLREQPLMAMEATLAQYNRYTPGQALERLQALRREVERHGGEFSLLWHNSSWNTYFWAPWQRVFLEFLKN